MDDRFLKARQLVAALKARHMDSMRRDSNIVGAAFGRRVAHKEISDEPAMVIYVVKKVPQRFIPPSRLLPRRMYVGGDCVQVDVVETGPIYPHAFTARERPAPSGISIGPPVIAGVISSGTLGCLVTDLTDGSLCILSNNHVLANENLGVAGDAILQPGSFDGGVDPDDRVATLKRFQMINATGNTVDCAIAQVSASDAPLVVDQMKNNLMPTPNPNHPAVGLLFAGGCNRTFCNPIGNVLSALNIEFLAGKGSTASVDIGDSVEKVGRTTEYQTSSVMELDASPTITYNFGDATFESQIATMWMSDPGDSGSIVCKGGEGSHTDHCSCGTTTATSSILGTDVTRERIMAEEVRDKFLRHTKIGRYGMDLFFLNEERLLERFRNTEIKQEDRDLARHLYHKYIEEARAAFVEADRSERTLTEQHFHDARNALRHAQKYMSQEEIAASEELFKVAEERGKGKKPREILAMLNDEKLLEQIKQIAGRVKNVRTEEGGPCGQ